MPRLHPGLPGDKKDTPTDDDIYDPKHWRRDALLQPESRDAYARLLSQGWTDALRSIHPDDQPKASDHAPVWVELKKTVRKRPTPRQSTTTRSKA